MCSFAEEANFEKFRNFSAMHQQTETEICLLVYEVPGHRIFGGCPDADAAVKYGNKYDGNVKTKNP